ALVYLDSDRTMIAGVTGPELGRRILTKLALAAPVQGAADPDRLNNFGEADLPPGPAVVIGAGARAIADRLRPLLRSAVTALDPAITSGCDFYKPPSPTPEG